MANTFQFQPGWEFNLGRIQASESRLAAAGKKVAFNQYRPDLKGYWKKIQSKTPGVFAQDTEFQVLGHWRDTNEQERGTCVGQGSSRGGEDTHTARIAKKVIPGKYTLIAYEGMYGGERHAHWQKTHQWGCQCGRCPDGLQGQDAAEWYSMVGMIARRIYEGIDLTKPAEHLAIEWNNSGVPDVVRAAAEFHKIDCHKCADFEEATDALAAECYGWICLPVIFTGSKQDKYGCCEPDGNGGHCTEICGVFLLPKAEIAIAIQQSWPLGAVHYPSVIQTINGPKQLRPGSYAVRLSVLEGIAAQHRDQVEIHVCDIPSESSFR